MARRYSKHSAQEIHWTRVGYNAVLQGLAYEQVMTKDPKVNSWITMGMVKARRKLDAAKRVREKQDAKPKRGPLIGVIPASHLDPNNWTPEHNIKALAQVMGMKPELAEKPEDVPAAPRGGWTGQQINEVIERLQDIVKPCPVCQSDAKLQTTDYMTFGIYCRNPDCRLKVERGIVNERGPRQCMQMVLSAWNSRPAYGAQIARLVEAAQNANDWLLDTREGTDPHDRAKDLAKALKPFTR